MTIRLLIGIYSVVRLVGLEQPPPGLYADAAVVAAEASALVQTGHDFHHERALFTLMTAGGNVLAAHFVPPATKQENGVGYCGRNQPWAFDPSRLKAEGRPLKANSLATTLANPHTVFGKPW